MIIEYSAIKIKVNPSAPYSILNPDTSSDSPSEKSNGVRLVSATQDVSHKATKNGDTKRANPSLAKPPRELIVREFL